MGTHGNSYIKYWLPTADLTPGQEGAAARPRHSSPKLLPVVPPGQSWGIPRPAIMCFFPHSFLVFMILSFHSIPNAHCHRWGVEHRLTSRQSLTLQPKWTILNTGIWWLSFKPIWAAAFYCHYFHCLLLSFFSFMISLSKLIDWNLCFFSLYFYLPFSVSLVLLQFSSW